MSAVSDEQTPQPKAATEPHFGRWMGSMWLYTALRFGLFFALWGILVLVGFSGLFAALLALVLSVPLSLVLLRKPRNAFTAQLQARVDARNAARADLDARLQDESRADPKD